MVKNVLKSSSAGDERLFQGVEEPRRESGEEDRGYDEERNDGDGVEEQLGRLRVSLSRT